MKKIVLIILLVTISFITSGCTNNLSSAEKLDDTVVSLLRNKTYDDTGLSKTEIALIDSFIDKETYDKKIVNLTSLSSYSDTSIDNHDDSFGVYEEDGSYFIKYSDIVFENIVDSELSSNYDNISYYATTIYYNGRILNITKDIIPILFDDTKGNSKYIYTYRGTAAYKDAIVSYYNSLYDDTGMRIIFNLKNNKIDSIDIAYDVSNDIYTNVTNSPNSSIFSTVVFTGGIVLILTFVIIFIIKKIHSSREI